MRHLAALLVGLVVGVAAVLVHRDGLLTLGLAVVTSLAVPLLLRSGTRPSLASAFALGWVVLVGLVLLGRPEGDWAVGGDLAGYALVATGAALVVLGTGALPARRRREAA